MGLPLSAEYRDRIAAAYRGEVYGEALFGALAELCARADRRRKWRVLERLELETRQRLRPIAQRLGVPVHPDAAQVERGRRHAAILARQRWMNVMDVFLAEVDGHVARFEELERMGPPEDAAILARVTAHEVALQSFARLEQLGRAADSVGPARALLEHEPAPELQQAAAS